MAGATLASIGARSLRRGEVLLVDGRHVGDQGSGNADGCGGP